MIGSFLGEYPHSFRAVYSYWFDEYLIHLSWASGRREVDDNPRTLCGLAWSGMTKASNQMSTCFECLRLAEKARRQLEGLPYP